MPVVGVKRANSELDYQVMFGRHRSIKSSLAWPDRFWVQTKVIIDSVYSMVWTTAISILVWCPVTKTRIYIKVPL